MTITSSHACRIALRHVRPLAYYYLQQVLQLAVQHAPFPAFV